MTQELNLGELVQAAEKAVAEDKAKEIQQKIRYVLNQIDIFKKKISKTESELIKQRGHLKKAEEKFKQLQEGRWEVLATIDINKALISEE